MLDWVGRMIGLPEQFMCLSDHNSKGGGVIQVSHKVEAHCHLLLVASRPGQISLSHNCVVGFRQ